ncbi:hypothetical protein HPB50_009968 [Hyalomma asiaticum]|uniref:Uncharacterized protein n=1 Tax=Hyalomma asiaticum TaxID=266040 RepID=A0ACB7RZK5_HYAAI|nr:hypothetical protein HPB50_009968 [Hyalomma asiaticum]
MRDYYSVLEVPCNVSPEESRRAYRQLAVGRLPDKNPDNKAEAGARFMKISEAYKVLPSESKRPQYDLHGRGGQDTGHQAGVARSQAAKAYNTGGVLHLHTS